MTLHAPDRLLSIKNDKNVDIAISVIHCRSHGAGGKTLEHWTPADKFRTDAKVFILSCVLANELYCSGADAADLRPAWRVLRRRHLVLLVRLREAALEGLLLVALSYVLIRRFDSLRRPGTVSYTHLTLPTKA